MSATVESIITDRIIKMLESGVIPWHRPWVGTQDFAYNRISAKTAIAGGHKVQPYSILNQLLLDRPGEWASFKQWEDCHCAVKKGEKASICVWWSPKKYPAKDKETGEPILDKDGNPLMKTHWILKYYNVFHISQVVQMEQDGYRTNKEGKKIANWVLTDKSPAPILQAEPLPCLASPIEEAEKVFNDYIGRFKIGFHHGGNQAYYAPLRDEIVLPEMDAFKGTEEYYSTLFHETTHSTGHESRLNRLSKTASFGNAEYSVEELCAEIGAASCMHRLGLSTDGTLENSAAYIQAWLKALKNNTKMVSSAAGKAEKAVALIFGESDQIANEGEE